MNKNASDRPRDPEARAVLDRLIEQVGAVRRRLLLRAALQTAALALVAVPIYVALYAWLDHAFELGWGLRLAALGLLTALSLALLAYGALHFFRHRSLSYAAAHTESRKDFDQRLVAAIEYVEQGERYPYSRPLAEQMIRRLDAELRPGDLRGAVPAWPSVLCGLVVLVALVGAALLVGDHLEYYRRYAARLTQPMAELPPLAATDLRVVSGDLIVETGEVFALRAELGGRIVPVGRLRLEPEPEEPAGAPEGGRDLDVHAAHDEEGGAFFETRVSLEEEGRYRYRFTTVDRDRPAASDWHRVRVVRFPVVTNVVAQVRFGAGPFEEAYEETVREDRLTVREGAGVTLAVEASAPLAGARAALGGEPLAVRELDGARFLVEFTAEAAGELVLDLVDREQRPGRRPHRIALAVREDAPPAFRLLSPAGDYVANDVASIPIAYEVTDDVGLKHAALVIETEEGPLERVFLETADGPKTGRLAHEIEMENLDVEFGDSLIYYAEARDVSLTGMVWHEEARSEPYFIELRPYQRLIHQQKPGLPPEPKQDLVPPPSHEGLIDLLNYARAFIKKTWAYQGETSFSPQDQRKLTAISGDVIYAGEQLVLIRDDPRSRFLPEQVARANTALDHFGRAARALATYEPDPALADEKAAYFILRSLVRDLEKLLCEPLGGTPPKERDKHKVEENVHAERFEKERLQWELEKLTIELAELAKEQDRLKAEFLNFLERQEQQRLEQEARDRDSRHEAREEEAQARPPGGDEPGGAGETSPYTLEGVLPPPPSGGSGQAQYAAGEQGSGTASEAGSEQPAEAGPREIMRMLQAQQNALRTELDAVQDRLASLPMTGEGGGSGAAQMRAARERAEEHLAGAAARMDAFDELMSRQAYEAAPAQDAMEEGHRLLGEAAGEIGEARLALAEERGDEEEFNAVQAEQLARQIEELARVYQEHSEAVGEQFMQDLAEQAEAVLEQLPDHLQTAAGMPTQDLGAPKGSSGGSGGGRDGGVPRGGGSAPSDGQGRGDGRFSGGEGADMESLASAFWSASIHARKQPTTLVEPDFSHPDYTEQEDAFFSATAAFGSEERR